jgi:cytochrome b subunit of formate dehydrogenase
MVLLFPALAGGLEPFGQEASPAQSAIEEETELITEDQCTDCHERSHHNTEFNDDLSHSVHAGFGCLDCHTDRATMPHQSNSTFRVGSEGCRSCHTDADESYQVHGQATIDSEEDIPQCADCHGDHSVLPSTVKSAKTHTVNLPQTCGKCHENLDLTTKYQILHDHPIEIYETSIHGQSTKGGIYAAATCNDCHSTDGTAHRILSPGDPASTINHFNIPKTCGRCHQGIEKDFWEGLHGQLVARGQTDAPVCTHCHGEHGIISPGDPRSPVSRAHLAEQTCSPCHESVALNERYGLPAGRLATFIDSYHGLKSKAGDPTVANCASCHGVHRILASSDPSSSIHPNNLQSTCSECHPRISEKIASIPIHSVGDRQLETTVAEIVEDIYIIAIVVIIGLMVLHWLIDLGRHIRLVMTAKPQVRRMRPHEVWQHTLLMVSFIVLVITGFADRFGDSWWARLLFGWEGGFELRGAVHRGAAIVLVATTFWHLLFLATSRRGRAFLVDMMPESADFTGFWQRILYNLGGREKSPEFGRFSYVEKAEYWALVWGTVVMIASGFVLWFDNWFIQYLPTSAMEVAVVVHYWEAWLATLAIGVWHLYSTVFSPHVYPMNPSWLTGSMPEEMYRHEHPAHLDQARKESEEWVENKLDKLTGTSDSFRDT